MLRLEVELVEWSYSNPHAVMVMRDKEGNHWVGEMGNIFSLSRGGINPDTLPVGSSIQIEGQKSREPINRVLVRVIRRNGEVLYGTVDE